MIEAADDPPAGLGLHELAVSRHLSAPVATLWGLWTTAEGLRRWWAPEGFVLSVPRLDLRIGGAVEFCYEEAGSRDHPDWRARMESAGLSTSWSARGAFTNLVPPRRVAFRQQLDFGRATRALEYRVSADLRPEGSGTMVAVVAASEPTRHWQRLGSANLQGQLDRLERAATSSGPTPAAD